MTFDRFHNALRVLLNIDMDEFITATTGNSQSPSYWEDREAADAAWHDWNKFHDDPHRWFIKAPTEKAKAIWALVEARQPKRYPNGAPMYAPDGMMLDDQGNRSIFDDVDA